MWHFILIKTFICFKCIFIGVGGQVLTTKAIKVVDNIDTVRSGHAGSVIIYTLLLQAV